MTIARGEIYFVNLNPIQGKEQAGTRPVLVLSIDVIAFLIHKRYIPDPEQFNQQRFKCAAQMREPLYQSVTLSGDGSGGDERRKYSPRLSD